MNQTPLFDIMESLSDNWTRVTLSKNNCEKFRSLLNLAIRVQVFPDKGTAQITNGDNSPTITNLTQTEIELFKHLSPQHHPSDALPIRNHFLN